MIESIEDMTAAATAAKPMIETASGVRYLNTRGSTLLTSSVSIGELPYSVEFQSVETAIAPISVGGTAQSKAVAPDITADTCENDKCHFKGPGFRFCLIL